MRKGRKESEERTLKKMKKKKRAKEKLFIWIKTISLKLFSNRHDDERRWGEESASEKGRKAKNWVGSL